MRIDSIDIASFGRFKDFHLDLSDGMTVIFGENEKGKTTIMSFIRMMFYGNSGKGTDIDKNPRVKYRPWNNDLMAGSVTFTHCGTRYRLEREFKKTNSADKISLINLDLNTVRSISGSTDIGSEFFGLTDAAFERSVFIGEPSLSAKNEAADGEINARLSNIAVTGDEDTSFETVNRRLQKAREEFLSRGGKKGKLDKALIRFEELENEIKNAKQLEAHTEILQRQAEEKEKDINANSAETARLFELLKNTDKIKKRMFVQRYIDAEHELLKTKEQLRLRNGDTADKAYIEKALQLIDATDKASDKVDDMRRQTELLYEEIDKLRGAADAYDDSKGDSLAAMLAAERDDLDQKIEAVKFRTKKLNSDLEELKPKKKVNPVFFAIGAVFAAVGVVFTGLQLYAAISLIAVGLIIAILGVVVKKTVKPDDSQLQSEIGENSRQLSKLLDQKQVLLEKIANHEKATNEKKIKLAADKALLQNKELAAEEKKTSLSAALTHYDECVQALLTHIGLLAEVKDTAAAKELVGTTAERLRTAELIIQKLSVLSDHAGCSSLAEAEEKAAAFSDIELPKMTESDIDSVKERFKLQSDKTGRLKSELTEIRAQIKRLTESGASVAVLERQKEELQKQIDGYSQFCGQAEIASQVLEEAFREMRKNYSDRLDSRTAEIFAMLAGEKYSSVNVSKDFELNVTTQEAFGLKSSAYLSGGTEDQLYLALRLSIAELITEEGEPLPIFMDDPLTGYDDARAEKAIGFLKGYSQNRQTVMFTCHSSFADMAKSHNINIKEL